MHRIRNIHQLIIVVHKLCTGNMNQVGGLFSLLEYLSQEFIVVDVQEYGKVIFGNVSYPDTIQVTYVNNFLYPKDKVAPKLALDEI